MKIVVVEDDLLIADLLEDLLVGAGYDVCGVADDVTGAVDLCRRHQPDLAVIDMRLAHGEHGTDVAARLGRRGRLGILYATGNTGQVLLSASDGEACITKPYLASDIVRALQIVHEMVGTGIASKPFPRNFQLLPRRQGKLAPEEFSHESGAGRTNT